MSSSFPFGFEPTYATVDHPDLQVDKEVDVHFLDGGMIDNTGLDSIVAILQPLAKSESELSKQILATLRARGVYLIEIDAGAGPGKASSSGPLTRLTQPIAGYNRGVFSSAMRSRDENVQLIESIIGKESFAYEPIQPTPESENVTEIMTTLAMPKKDIARLSKAFEDPRQEIRDALERRYDSLIFKIKADTPGRSSN